MTNATPLTTAADMYAHLVSLLPSDVTVTVGEDPDFSTNPHPLGPWMVTVDDDEIVGSGDTREAALRDALLTAAQWAQWVQS